MRKTLVLAWLILAAGFGFTLAANEKPSEEYSGAMKSNAATGQALKRDVSAKDYAAIAKDAAAYKANFAKIEAFWAAKKVDDAIMLSKAAAKAASDLETAANAKNDESIMAATTALNATCGSCHMAHRERLPDMTFEIK